MCRHRLVVVLPSAQGLIARWLSLILPQRPPRKRTSPPSLDVREYMHTYISHTNKLSLTALSHVGGNKVWRRQGALAPQLHNLSSEIRPCAPIFLFFEVFTFFSRFDGICFSESHFQSVSPPPFRAGSMQKKPGNTPRDTRTPDRCINWLGYSSGFTVQVLATHAINFHCVCFGTFHCI